MNAVVPFLSEQSKSRMTADLLLIDDNAVQAATRQTILRRAGYFVIAALNPARALEQFQGGEFRGHWVGDYRAGLDAGDERLGVRSGPAQAHPQMPVLVISGLEEAEREYAGLDVTFRMKPLLPDQLLATVRALIEEDRTNARLSAVS